MNVLEITKLAEELNDKATILELEAEIVDLKIQGLKEYIINDARTYYEEDRDYYMVKQKIISLTKKSSSILIDLVDIREQLDKLFAKNDNIEIN